MPPLLPSPIYRTKGNVFETCTRHVSYNCRQAILTCNHKPCSWQQDNHSTLLKIRGRGAARLLVTSMVQYMKLMIPLISVCHGTDHIYIHYRAKYRTVLGWWVKIALYKQRNGRPIHTAHTGDYTQEINSRTDRITAVNSKTNRNDAVTRNPEYLNTHNARWSHSSSYYIWFIWLVSKFVFCTKEINNVQFRRWRH